MTGIGRRIAGVHEVLTGATASTAAIAAGSEMTTGRGALHHHAGAAETATTLGTVITVVISAAAHAPLHATVATETTHTGAGAPALTGERRPMATGSTCLGASVPMFLTCRSYCYRRSRENLSAGSREPSITKG